MDRIVQNSLKAHAAQHSEAWEAERDARLQMEARLTAALESRLVEEGLKGDEKMKQTAETAGRAFLAACIGKIDESADELRDEMENITSRGKPTAPIGDAAGDASKTHVAGLLQKMKERLEGFENDLTQVRRQMDDQNLDSVAAKLESLEATVQGRSPSPECQCYPQ